MNISSFLYLLFLNFRIASASPVDCDIQNHIPCFPVQVTIPTNQSNDELALLDDSEIQASKNKERTTTKITTENDREDNNANLEDITDPQIHPIKSLEYVHQLNEGVGLYQAGERADAMQRFLSLSMLPEVPKDIRQESIVYIAEILYIQGDKDSAKRFFEQLLLEEPNYQIDRFRHPPDVCGYFDFVKSYTKQLTPKINDTKIESFPVIGYLPVGIYFWVEPKPRIGKKILHTGIQGSFFLASSILYGSLLAHHEYLDSDVATKEILERRLAFQRITTVAFYALWGINIIDAQRSWQIDQQDQKDITNE